MSLSRSEDQYAVTVVVPTRNRAHILSQTVESILSQEGVSVGLVVVDDASTDDTAAVLSKYPGVKVIRHREPTEQRKARNDGARVARTSWIAFCDDDDLWAPTKLRRQLDVAVASGADWCTASAIFVDERLSPIGGLRLGNPRDVPRLIIKWNIIPGGGSGVLMRKALFDEVGGFREDARYVEDWDLWIRLSKHGTPACVDELLVAQRLWARSFSQIDQHVQYEAFLGMATRYGDGSRSFMARPRHVGYFEVAQRLRTESRRSVARDLPRIIRNSPEDCLSLLAMLALPDSALRRLRLHGLGKEEVRLADNWLKRYRNALSES
jgi:glycosyltransferase involved in cell wall biosynthesis